MQVSKLSQARRYADKLIELGNKEDTDPSRQSQMQIVERLSPLLRITQGVPCGLGSGRTGVKYKVHALAHATRLTSKSWSDTAALLRATITWTGDLGTESHLVQYRCNLQKLFGDWIRAGTDVLQGASGAAQHEDEGDRAHADDDFDFMPHAAVQGGGGPWSGPS